MESLDHIWVNNNKVRFYLFSLFNLILRILNKKINYKEMVQNSVKFLLG